MTDNPETANRTRDIVCAYVSHNAISAADLPGFIAAVHRAVLAFTGDAMPIYWYDEPVKPVPAVPIEKSVTPEAIYSLEDGKPYRSLRRHLTARGITVEQYRAKWNLPADYPVVAAAYSATRSALAKRSGLGRKD